MSADRTVSIRGRIIRHGQDSLGWKALDKRHDVLERRVCTIEVGQ